MGIWSSVLLSQLCSRTTVVPWPLVTSVMLRVREKLAAPGSCNPLCSPRAKSVPATGSCCAAQAGLEPTV